MCLHRKVSFTDGPDVDTFYSYIKMHLYQPQSRSMLRPA